MKQSLTLQLIIHMLEEKLINNCEYHSYAWEVKQGSTIDDVLKNIVCFNQIVNRFNQYHVTYKLNLLTSRNELRFDKR